jgi:hypothetical protein
MSSKDPQDRHFSRRLKAAVEGLHLPSEEELLRGMAFFRGDLGEDIREYAERLWRRLRKRGDLAFASLAAALEELTVEQSDDGVRSLMKALDGVEEIKGVPIEACRLRCRFYLASSGDSDAAASIAGEAAIVALRDINNRDDLRMATGRLSFSPPSATMPRRKASASSRSSRHSCGAACRCPARPALPLCGHG